MRIAYIELRNFIGIYNGTGKTEIKIDFSRSTNRIIMLIGKNGSGKTTLLSTLHPFADTMDLRSDIIMMGKDGYKEIHIEHNGVKYKIEHHYMNKGKKKSVKSFIAEWVDIAWEELNENGTVGSFKQLVEEKLDVDEGFFKLARIGSNVTNFIDLKTADRKKFISNFLPNIEEYLYYYKIVNDKWSAMKKNITNIANQINKLDTYEHLESLLTNTNNQITNKESKRNRFMAKLNTNKGGIKTLDPDGSIRNTHNELTKKFKELLQAYNKLEDIKDRLVSQNPKFAEYNTSTKAVKVVSNMERRIDLLDSDIKNLNGTKQRLTGEITDLNNDLTGKEIQLAKYKTDKNLDEYKELKQKYEERKDEIQSQLAEPEFNYLEGYEYLTIDMVDNYFGLLTNICKRISTVSAKYELNVIEAALSGKSVNISTSNEALKKLKSEMFELSKKHNYYKGKQDQTEILKKRPSACKIDSCAFIQQALKFKDADSEVEKYENLIDKKQGEIDKLEKKIDKLSVYDSAITDVKAIWQNVQDNANTIQKFPNAEYLKDFNSFAEFFMKDKDKFLNNADINDFVYLMKEANDIETTILPDINRNIDVLESKADLINSLKGDIERINKQINIKDETLGETNTSLEMETKKKSVSEALLKRLNSYLDTITKMEDTKGDSDNIKSQLGTISDTIQKIVELNNENKTLAEEIEGIDEELTPLNKELDRIKFNMEKLKEYTATKAELEKEFGNVNIVKDALSPTKGIPLLFIDIYLKQTKSIANRLLDVAFKGKFNIEGFKLTDKDFYIHARKEDGQLVEDISTTSQGERALSSLSLSMALIQQSLKKYNILLLDELDSELDEENRRAFVEILDTQFNSLGIEQAFLISHNKEFDTQPVDLILMPRHGVDLTDKEYMKDKNVLYKS
jgi:DNA repair exonuclease SbcCD ATPase subunit